MLGIFDSTVISVSANQEIKVLTESCPNRHGLGFAFLLVRCTQAVSKHHLIRLAMDARAAEAGATQSCVFAWTVGLQVGLDLAKRARELHLLGVTIRLLGS